MSVQLGNVPLVTRGLVSLYDPANYKNYLLDQVEVLVVAGGGSGGNCQGNSGTPAGGGGGGGVLYSSSYEVTPGSGITVTVGNGGAQATAANILGNNGQNSVFGIITAEGGGTGGGDDVGSPYGSGTNTRRRGNDGGSGGGSGNSTTDKTTGRPGQGFGGGGSSNGAGGGGGAGGPGGNSPWRGCAGQGGNGLPFTISGSLVYYAGGGGGGGFSGLLPGPGGIGGGGVGARQTGSPSPGGAGTPGLGAGGGGGAANQGVASVGGAGGKGVVIVRYPGPQKASGGDTISTIGGYTIHTFNNSGTFTPFSSVPTNSSAVYGLQDFVGHNSGYSSGGTTYSTSNGGTFEFDGSNDHIIVRDSVQHKFNNELSFQIWCSLSNASGYDGALMKTTSNAWSDGWGFFQYSNYIRFFIDNWDGTGIAQIAKSNTFDMTCYCGVYDGSNLKLYENGVLVATSTSYVSNIVDTTSPLFIGNAGGASYPWSGKIGQVLIYNKALSSSEVLQNYNSSKARHGL